MFLGKASCLFFFCWKCPTKSTTPRTFQQVFLIQGWSKVWKKRRSFHKLRNLKTHTLETAPFSKRNFMNGMEVYWSFSLGLFGSPKKKESCFQCFCSYFLWGSESFSRETSYTRPFVEILTTSNSSTECTIAGAAPRARRPLAIKSILTSAHQLHIGTTQLCNEKNQQLRQGT